MDIILAENKNIKEIIDIIKERIKWFEDNNIKQWDETYLEWVNEEYLNNLINKNELYIILVNSNVAGIVAILEKDTECWENGDDNRALYIHHFTTKKEYKDLGKYVFNYVEELAIQRGKIFLRLDCMNSNDKLNEYYENFGFKKVGVFKSEYYIGTLREKKLK